MLMTNAQTLPMKAKDAEITQAAAQAKAMADMQQAFSELMAALKHRQAESAQTTGLTPSF